MPLLYPPTLETNAGPAILALPSYFFFSPEPVSYFLSQVSFSLARHEKQVATSCYVLSRFFLSHPSHIGSICRRRDALGTHTVGSALMSGVVKRFLEFMAVYLLNPQ